MITFVPRKDEPSYLRVLHNNENDFAEIAKGTDDRWYLYRFTGDGIPYVSLT